MKGEPERDIEKGGERILQRNSVSKITLFYIDRSVFFLDASEDKLRQLSNI